MKISRWLLYAGASVALGSVGQSSASEPTADRLGKDLTPVGAERQGTATGIPPWTGGSITAPANWKRGEPRPNPYDAERPLVSISAANVEQYKDRLTPGQIELIKGLKGYRMDVYPAKRNCGYPADYYARTQKNIGYSKLAENGHDLAAAQTASVPFPIPSNGAEVVWNHKLRWQGEGLSWRMVGVASPKDPSSAAEVNVANEHIMFPMGIPKNKDVAGAGGVEGLFVNPYVAPASIAGDATLSRSYLNKAADIWLYFSSQRRVRRAPTYTYDAPVTNAENLLTVDQYQMFSGRMDRYDFKLLGKKEIYVPYNWYSVNSTKNKISEVAGPQYLSREKVRYEAHRVWVVEATVKPSARHTFPRRVLYVDEDSWSIVHQDMFDGQGKVQRVMESGVFMAWEIPACIQQTYVSYDLSSGRYLVDRLPAEQPEADLLAVREGRLDESQFDPEGLRRTTKR